MDSEGALPCCTAWLAAYMYVCLSDHAELGGQHEQRLAPLQRLPLQQVLLVVLHHRLHHHHGDGQIAAITTTTDTHAPPLCQSPPCLPAPEPQCACLPLLHAPW